MSVLGLVVVLGVIVVATAYGVVRRARGGRLREVGARNGATTTLTAADLGQPLGERATLVQFSSAFCRPCVAARQVLGRAADIVPGVAHIEIDAESHLELVRRLNVAATPTTLLLDRDGVERHRAGGVPRRHDVVAALAAVVDP